jgi:membrane-bound ClpP family serine protease
MKSRAILIAALVAWACVIVGIVGRLVMPSEDAPIILASGGAVVLFVLTLFRVVESLPTQERP